MIKYLKYKVYIAMVAITIFFIMGFIAFIKDGSTVLLAISSASFILHLVIYYVFVKRKATTTA